ncbi:MAG: TIM barrel protein [Phycisphaerales bacterium]|nr:TIM barrel protein [Phycisphaerales bacterium]
MSASPPTFPPPGRMPLSVALAGLAHTRDARSMIERAAAAGARAIQLDATHPDLRPRQLSRSARRDLAALLRRLDLACSGVDLFVPPAHLSAPAHADHAIAAFVQAIDFVAEMAQLTGAPPVLSTVLPSSGSDSVAQAAVDQLAQAADASGAFIADHAWTAGGHARAHVARDAPIGVGIDPAAVLLAGQEPSKAASALGASTGPGIRSARLSDTDGAARVEPGARNGRLDGAAYAIALHTAGYERHVVLDVRGVADPWGSMGRALERFDHRA